MNVDTRMQNLQKLEKLVSSWGETKTQADALKKEVDQSAAEIKQIMIAEKLDSSTSGEYTAKLSFKKKEVFDDEGLVEYIKNVLWKGKSSKTCPYIKTVEQVNWEALEDAIYKETLTKEQILGIDKYKTVTETPELRLSKPKKEK